MDMKTEIKKKESHLTQFARGHEEKVIKNEEQKQQSWNMIEEEFRGWEKQDKIKEGIGNG